MGIALESADCDWLNLWLIVMGISKRIASTFCAHRFVCCVKWRHNNYRSINMLCYLGSHRSYLCHKEETPERIKHTHFDVNQLGYEVCVVNTFFSERVCVCVCVVSECIISFVRMKTSGGARDRHMSASQRCSHLKRPAVGFTTHQCVKAERRGRTQTRNVWLRPLMLPCRVLVVSA